MRGDAVMDPLRLGMRAGLDDARIEGRVVVLRADLDFPLFPASSEENREYWSELGASTSSSGYEDEAEDDVPEGDSTDGRSTVFGGR